MSGPSSPPTAVAARRARRARLVLAALATIALLRVLLPYLGAIFWAIVLAIVFAPLHARLLRATGRRVVVAGVATLLAIVVGVGVPLALLVGALLRQASALYRDVVAGRIDLGAYAARIADAMPLWLHRLFDEAGIGDLGAVRDKLSASALEASRFVAAHLLGIGLNAFSLALSAALMLYLLYVLLTRGDAALAWIERFSPLPAAETRSLAGTFATVIRATVKGGVVMAATQGALGGIVLGALGIEAPLFWGLVFGLLSMIPAVGAGLLWAPIAVYFLVTGEVAKGLLLIVFGAVVLTIVDNVLRPLLVGHDTHLPAYLILVATLGAIASFGLNGIIVGPVVAAMFVAIWKLFDAQPPAAS